MTELHLSGNKLTNLGNLSNCTELEYLAVDCNKITHVDWRNLPPALTWLQLHNNLLTTVGDCSHCTQLSELVVGSNQIKNIDWKKPPPALTRFHLDNNNLTTVDLYHCTQLEWLDLQDNPTLRTIESIPNRNFVFYVSSSVKVLGRKCFHKNTYSMLKEVCKQLKWQLEQPPVEVLLQDLEAVLEYYKEECIRTTRTR